MQIKCTQCGAQVPIESDADFIRCPYCETALYVETDRTVAHYYLEPQLKAKDLPPLLQKRLSYMEIKDQAQIRKYGVQYFPFWRLDVAQGGSVTVPASTPPYEDMAQIKTPVGDYKLFNKERMENENLVEPLLLLEEAALDAQGVIGSKDKKFKSAALVHVPLYHLEYDCGQDSFRASIDAVSGAVYGDIWPAPAQRKKDFTLGWIATLTVLVFFLEAALIPGFFLVILAYIPTSVGVYFLARSTLRKMGW